MSAVLVRTLRTEVADFGSGWSFAGIYEWDHAGMKAWHDSGKVMDFMDMMKQKGIYAYCRACGHAELRYAHLVTRDGTTETVGSECLEKVIGETQARKITAAIASEVGVAVREWERPFKQKQLEAVLPRLREVVLPLAAKYNWDGEGMLKRLDARVWYDTNPDITAKTIREFLPDFKWQWTPEQKAERQRVREEATVRAAQRWSPPQPQPR